MIDRTRLLEESRQAVTKLIQQARITQHAVDKLREQVSMKLRSKVFQHAVAASAEACDRMETILSELYQIADTLDQITADDPELFGKLDVVGDELAELNNELFGDDNK